MAKGRKRKAGGKAQPRGVNKPFTAEQQRVFMQLVAATLPQSEAAKHVGVSRQAISNRKRRDPQFLTEIERNEAVAQFNLVAIILKAAPKDHRAAQWLLERRWPEYWARADIRAQMESGRIRPDEVAEAVEKMLIGIRARFMPKDATDVDADEPAAEAPS